MDFFKLIQSLDELIYEVVGWLLFYPLTLWRIVRSPMRMMKLAEQELSVTDRMQFPDVVAPALFLFLTLILLHSVELATVGENRLVASDRRFSALIGSDTSLIIFEILVFSTLPLIAAVRLLRARGTPLDKLVMRPPFYAQCYVAGLFALLWNAAQLVAENQFRFNNLVAAALLAAALIWLFLIEARWFSAELQVSPVRGSGQAAIMIVQWLVILLLIAVLLP